MNWLVALFALEAGLVPQVSVWNVSADRPDISTDTGYYTQLDAELLVAELLFVGGAVTTYVWSRNDGDYTVIPSRSNYDFRTGIRYRGVEVGWRHMCAHPIAARWDQIDGDLGYEYSHDQLYIRLSGSVDLLSRSPRRGGSR